MTHYHLVGIGGTGLSAIARVLFERGESVSGSDLASSPITDQLKELGISVSIGHAAGNIEGADMIIRSSAIPESNPEIIAANALGLPVLKRREFLSELTGGKKVIAIAGTHGKTTTTAMTAWCLEKCGMHPSYVIGSASKNLGRNAAAGTGEFFVIEADEYDNMFLGLAPDILVITNIEHDHPDCFPTENDYFAAFRQLVKRITPGGYLIAFHDNQGVQALLDNLHANLHLITYGAGKSCDLQIGSLTHQASAGVTFTIKENSIEQNDAHVHEVSLGLPGTHNAYNATAVFAIASVIGLDISCVKDALQSFSGTGRRFDIIGQVAGITVIDDYGHHPTELKATLAAARNSYPDQDIWAVWQPHTYSRTQELFDDFTKSFVNCDHIIVTEIYRSREPQQNYSSSKLVNAIDHGDKYFAKTFGDALAILKNNLSSGDVLIVFSAGDANQITRDYLDYLQETKGQHD